MVSSATGGECEIPVYSLIRERAPYDRRPKAEVHTG